MEHSEGTIPRKGRSDLATAGRFGLVGLMNSVIDFGAFSIFRKLGVGLVLANMMSMSFGMAFSFFLNRRFVFASTGSVKRQMILFLMGTAFGLYVLQSLAIVAVTRYLPSLLDFSVAIARVIGLRSADAEMLVRSNTAKAVATVVSMTWNFSFYRWAVFATTGTRPGERG